MKIKQLERGIEEFKGTEQELVVIQELLGLLKKESLYDRWIDVYLSALYRHPTHELIGCFANQAILIGQAAGRQMDVRDGFRHLGSIPLDFEAKRQVEAAVMNVGTENQLARNDGSRVL